MRNPFRPCFNNWNQKYELRELMHTPFLSNSNWTCTLFWLVPVYRVGAEEGEGEGEEEEKKKKRRPLFIDIPRASKHISGENEAFQKSIKTIWKEFSSPSSLLFPSLLSLTLSAGEGGGGKGDDDEGRWGWEWEKMKTHSRFALASKQEIDFLFPENNKEKEGGDVLCKP